MPNLIKKIHTAV